MAVPLEKMEDHVMAKFVHDWKERFKRFLSPPLDTNLYDRSRNGTSLRESGEDSLLDYERYHWGSGPGPWY
jgi:hypothetical protein